ncbi:mevalonate kinase [Streptococcus loxodontisalivarius]|uniref:Mevalonate kinase n=1 Tax=Streptococcus loxodontisalivarius TaxID=1349415 RepID=A0ABS2PSX0_9STRE|nr:mevalonate kinase [Streptococcus loxodontisalivarius]MBM7643139.1 mevalonate kinase [Streptococcus loxodontisalivarius]
MTKTYGVGKSHSKIILTGEHSVVYGYPAIALPLKNIEVVCHLKKSDQALELDIKDPLSTAVFAALEYLEIEDRHLTYDIESTVPEKRGMGSSAAVAIAAIRAVFDYYQKDLDNQVLEMLVNQAEIIAHTNPSGLDAKTCLSDQAIKFIRNVGFSELAMDLDAQLIIADTGIHGHTREAVEKVEALEEKALPLLHGLGQLTDRIELAISAKNLDKIGQAMTLSHQLLKELGVSSAEANHLVDTALYHGALGAKMSGGGLGGCIITLVKDKEAALILAQQLEEEGAVNTWIENL